MVMTREEIQARAQERAETEHLQSFKINDGLYLVKSRKLAPGCHHMVAVRGTAISCDCMGYGYRQSCTHVEVVRRRLERATASRPKGGEQAPRLAKVAPAPVPIPSEALRQDWLPQEDADAEARVARKRQAERDIEDLWG